MEDLLTSHAAVVDANQLTKREWVRIWWGLLWRSILTTAAGLAVTMPLGFVLGVVGGMIILAFGGDLQQFKLPMQILGGGIGFVIGMGFYAIWLRWIFRARFGNLRLALLRIAVTSEPATPLGQQVV